MRLLFKPATADVKVVLEAGCGKFELEFMRPMFNLRIVLFTVVAFYSS